MNIDASNYLDLGRDLLMSPNRWRLPKPWMSPAMQFETALVQSFFGNYYAPGVIKLFNFGLWLGVLVLVYQMVKLVVGDSKVGLFAVALVAFSRVFQSYVAIAQWEIPASFFLCLGVYGFFRALRAQRQCAGWMALSATSLVILCFYRAHFLIGVVACLVLVCRKAIHERPYRKHALLFLSIFLGLSVPINLRLNAACEDRMIVFQTFLNCKNSIHAEAAESNFPWKSASESARSGFDYVRESPIGFARLCLRRLPVMTGVEADWWLVESNYVRILSTFGLSKKGSRIFLLSVQLVLILSLFGSVFILKYRRKTFLEPERVREFYYLAMAIICIGIIPQFFVGASTRFWVPVIPFFCVLISSSAFLAIQKRSGYVPDRQSNGTRRIK